MNRQEKRKIASQYKKILKKTTLPKEVKQDFISFKLKNLDVPEIPEGTTVKIDYEAITSNPSYDKMKEDFKSSIELLKDKECIVEYDEKYKKNPYLMCLKEDTHIPKWLFSKEDLIVVKKNKNIIEKGLEN